MTPHQFISKNYTFHNFFWVSWGLCLVIEIFCCFRFISKSSQIHHDNFEGLKVRQNRNDFCKQTFPPKKTNEQIQFYYLLTCFCSFLGIKWRHLKDISKLTDLYHVRLWLHSERFAAQICWFRENNTSERLIIVQCARVSHT